MEENTAVPLELEGGKEDGLQHERQQKEEEVQGHFSDNKESPSHSGLSLSLRYKLWELVCHILPTGCYAFGGPTAHLAVFHDLFVKKLRWLTDKEFVDLLALGMTLPGPTSSEFCIAVGTYRAGVLGAIVAFLCFTVPSFFIMLAAGLGATHMDPNHVPDWMLGLAPAATALIFVAFGRLGLKIVGDSALNACISLIAASVTLLVQNDARIPPRSIMWILPLMLVVGGSLTLAERKYQNRRRRREGAAAVVVEDQEESGLEGRSAASTNGGTGTEDAGIMGSTDVSSDTYDHVPVSKWSSLVAFLLIVAFLLYLLVNHLAKGVEPPLLHVFSSFFIVGITIYGGGQVMLPLLVSVAVDPGWLSMDQFMVGFAIVQMTPGPLSNFAAYIGAIYMGVPGAIVGVVGFFLPGILLIIAVLPLWERVRKIPNVRPFLAGANATGLGLILAVGVALFLKVVRTPADAVVSIVIACVVGYLNYSSFKGVMFGALLGFLFSPTCLNWGQQAYIAITSS